VLIQATGPARVICTNCSDAGSGSTIALIALLVALASLVVAAAALIISRRQLEINEREHQANVAQRTSRARIGLTLTCPHLDDEGRLTAHATTWLVNLQIGIKNAGDRAGRNVTLNVLVPASLARGYWSDPVGRPLGTTDAFLPTSESVDGIGGADQVHYLAKTLDHVPVRSGTVAHVRLEIHPEQLPLTVLVRASYDDMDDGEPDAETRLTIRAPEPRAG
jgi:hypothetical protein